MQVLVRRLAQDVIFIRTGESNFIRVPLSALRTACTEHCVHSLRRLARPAQLCHIATCHFWCGRSSAFQLATLCRPCPYLLCHVCIYPPTTPLCVAQLLHRSATAPPLSCIGRSLALTCHVSNDIHIRLRLFQGHYAAQGASAILVQKRPNKLHATCCQCSSTRWSTTSLVQPMRLQLRQTETHPQQTNLCRSTHAT